MFGVLLERFCGDAAATRVKLMSEVITGPWEALLDGRADLIVAVGQSPSVGGYRAKRLNELELGLCVVRPYIRCLPGRALCRAKKCAGIE